jgi:SAM-dependent methyltransferase
MSAPTAIPYDSFIAEFYDYIPTVTVRRDLNFYLSAAREYGDPILELGCGTGRVLLPLAREGSNVAGLDISEAMLARCRAKLAGEKDEVRRRVQLQCGDMTDFDLDVTFRLIIIPFRPFQHLLEVEQQLACLRCAHRHLAPGGRLILDVFQTDARRIHDPAFLKETPPLPEINLPDGRKLVQTERTVAFHRAEQRNDVELIHYIKHPDGRQERLVFAFTLRYFFRFEVEHLLARTGFRVAELCGDFDRSALRDDSPEMLFVAEKI